MALDANTYGTIPRLETLVGDVLINSSTARTFSATTVPSTTQAEQTLDDIAAEMNVHLLNAGYSVPVVEGTDNVAFDYMRAVNVWGAAVLVLDSLPGEAYTAPNSAGVPQGRKQHWQNMYLHGLKVIDDGQLGATKESTGGHLDDIRIGSQKDSNGNTNLPIFTRTLTDEPNSRSLIET